jgi:hypothetical protein
MNKKALTEADIRTKFITPGFVAAGWDVMTQIREEAFFTKGRVIVRGKTVRRGEAKKADYILDFKPSLPLAVVVAKDNDHSVGAGMQQALLSSSLQCAGRPLRSSFCPKASLASGPPACPSSGSPPAAWPLPVALEGQLLSQPESWYMYHRHFVIRSRASDTNGGAISGLRTATRNCGNVAPRCCPPLNEYMKVALAISSDTLSFAYSLPSFRLISGALAFLPAMSLSMTECPVPPQPVCLMSSPRTAAAPRFTPPLCMRRSLSFA